MSDLLCGGCGVALQTKDKTVLGYVPETSLTKEEILCQRCFKLKHYNEHIPVDIEDDEFLTMVSEIGHTEGLIVHLIDLFDVSGTLIESLPRIIGNNPILLVGNKVDLLPKSTNHRKVIHWLRQLANEANLNVVDVHLISSHTGQGIEELAQAVEIERAKKDVYVVGVTNVGKSTFINQFIQRATGIKEAITTSYFPGTTLGFIEIPLSNQTSLIDTPGIVNKAQIAHYVSNKDLKKITPRKEVKARGYQLNSEQTLFIGGLARFDFIRGEKQSFICYFSNEIPLHRTRLDKATDLYLRQAGKLLSPPNNQTLEKLPKLVGHTFKLKAGRYDIVFPGLGWITTKLGDVTIEAYAPQGVSVSFRKSFY